MRIRQAIIIFVAISIAACGDKHEDEFIVGDVPMVVGMFKNYYGNYVRVVGYMHKPEAGNVLELIPSENHQNLQPPANVLRLLLFSDEKIRNGIVESEMASCVGKVTYVSGRVGIFSGLPAIVDIRGVSC